MSASNNNLQKVVFPVCAASALLFYYFYLLPWSKEKELKLRAEFLESCKNGKSSLTKKILSTARKYVTHTEVGRDVNGLTSLHLASYCEGDNVGLVEELLLAISENHKANPREAMKYVNAIEPNGGMSALQLATISANVRIVQRLVDFGCELDAANYNNQTASLIAACNNEEDIFNILMSKGSVNNELVDCKGRSSLYYACRNGNVTIAKKLTQYAIDNKKVEKILSQADTSGYQPLHVACGFKNTSIVALLLKLGADVNATAKDGSTPLIFAMRLHTKKEDDGNNTTENVLKLLLSQGADVTKCNAFGLTVLHSSCGGGGSKFQPTIAKALITYISDSRESSVVKETISAQDNDGIMSLHYLCKMAGEKSNNEVSLSEVLDVAKALLNYTDVNCVDYGRSTPLMVLAWGEGTNLSVELTKFLLNNNADGTLENARGWSVLHQLQYRIKECEKAKASRLEKCKEGEEQEEKLKEEEMTHNNFILMYDIIRQRLTTSENGISYLNTVDFDKLRDFNNREYADSCGSHNRIPLDVRQNILNDDHSITGIQAYINRFKSNNGRFPKTVVLMGAGVSVNSGIPDFRSKTGLYRKHGLNSFDLKNENFWEMVGKVFGGVITGKHKPTKAHMLIKQLQDCHALLRVYTQNIDMLESAAGVLPENIIEAHGSLKSAECTVCKRILSDSNMKTLWDQVTNGANAQDCTPYCNMFPKDQENEHGSDTSLRCSGMIRPRVVFFGEPLPRIFDQSADDLAECELLIVMGTSLVVYPFALLPKMVPELTPRFLINHERSGPFQFVGVDGKFASSHFRDAIFLGDCDEGAELLIPTFSIES